MQILVIFFWLQEGSRGSLVRGRHDTCTISLETPARRWSLPVLSGVADPHVSDATGSQGSPLLAGGLHGDVRQSRYPITVRLREEGEEGQHEVRGERVDQLVRR